VKLCPRCGRLALDAEDRCPTDAVALVARTPTTGDPWIGATRAGVELTGWLVDGRSATFYAAREVESGRARVVKRFATTTPDEAARLATRASLTELRSPELYASVSAVWSREGAAVPTSAAAGAELGAASVGAGSDALLADGDVALVMESLRGRTLEAYLIDGPKLGPTGLGRFLARIAGALTWLHRRGRVHGALEPRKLWIDEGRGAEEARLLDTTSAELERVTPVDPRFVAPELADAPGEGAPGEGARAKRAARRVRGERVDLYALGQLALALRAKDEGSEIDALIAELADPDPRRRPADALALSTRLGALGFPPPQGSLRPERRSMVPGVELPSLELWSFGHGTKEALRFVAESPESVVRALMQSEEAVRDAVLDLVDIAQGQPRRRRRTSKKKFALLVIIALAVAYAGWRYAGAPVPPQLGG
jgi:hypothetical protein